MLNTEFSPWPSYSEEEIALVASVLRSGRVNYWTGDQGRKFESEFAQYMGSSYAVAVANGTLALDLIWNCMGLGVGDEVIVTSRTFLASVSSIVNTGAKPVFVDIDRDTQNIDPVAVEKALTAKTKAILAVHLSGWPCELDSLVSLANSHGCLLVEDCAQAHGALYRGRSVGSIGFASAWSFCQDKIMTTGGEGGMVTTNDKELWSNMWSYKDHGKSWHSVYEKDHPPGFRWLHDSFGTNWRLTEVQSAIGRSQLKVLPTWSQRRKDICSSIWSAANDLEGLRVPSVPEHIEHGCYKCYVFVETESLKNGWSRDRIIEQVNAKGVPLYSGSCSQVYMEKAFENTDLRPKYKLENALELEDTSLMFLCHPTLTDVEVEKTCQVIRDVMIEAL